MKCAHCPVDGKCNGEDNQRLCQLTDKDHPDYNPSYLNVLSPNIINKAANLVQSVTQFVASGFEVAAEDVYLYRLNVCRHCDSFDDPTCQLCGCNMTVKAKIAAVECPLKKWVATKETQAGKIGCSSCGKK